MKISELIVRLQEKPEWHGLNAVVRSKHGLSIVDVLSYNYHNMFVCLEEAIGEPASEEEQVRITKAIEQADAKRLALAMIEHTQVWREHLERAYIAMREIRARPLSVLQDLDALK